MARTLKGKVQVGGRRGNEDAFSSQRRAAPLVSIASGCSGSAARTSKPRMGQRRPTQQRDQVSVSLMGATTSPRGATTTARAQGENCQYIVAGDIGGTNARFQLWQVDKPGQRTLVFRKKYPTASFPTFIEALLEFENDCKLEVRGGGREYLKPSAAAFAAAGVVVENKFCKMTNLDWIINSEEVQQRLGWKRASVLNDFEAVGYGVLAVEEADQHVIHPAKAIPKEPKVVLGPGTGFGQAQLFWNAKHGNYTVMPSEGAHGDFGPRGEKQRGLSEFIERQKGYCELEHVCCGPGLENIYDYLLSSKGEEGKDRMVAQGISEAALSGSDEDAHEAVVMLLSILGQEAGNWALRSLARGGVYIAGGITPKLLPILQSTGCLHEAFLHRQSRFSQVIESVPLVLITNDDIGLSGSCLYAERALFY